MSKNEEDPLDSSSENDTDSLNDENDNDFNKKKSSGAMMSLFASYYGIDQSNDEENIINNPEQYIDTIKFNSNAYVKKLLLQSPLDDLLSKDIKISQEIKNLDSDMQMLVYDNYKKFISATETIKRMKSNVEIMDDDITAVKLKMDKICVTSSNLDESLHEQRSKVDKLIRIRRLLSRLEFLTELPERLQEMIENEMYQPAVQLYNKTIHVLNKHSSVLSFKNIQERTQSMMKDLTGKVINLLDDTSLDTVKLTQYVTILRLMQASKIRVVNKLINAHQYRANMLLNQFTIKSNNQSNHTLKQIMKFHQILFSGLIEACNGIYELFCNTEYSISINQANSKKNDNEEDNEIEQHKQSHSLLVNTINKLLTNYQSIIINELNSFLISIKQLSYQIKQIESNLNKSSVDVESKDSLENSHRRLLLKYYELEEEFQSWLMFIRQSILDHVYLDRCMHECEVSFNTVYTRSLGLSGTLSQRINRTHSSESANFLSSQSISPSNSPLASTSQDTEISIHYITKPYATSILHILNDYIDYVFYRRITNLISSIQSTSLTIVSASLINKEKLLGKSNSQVSISDNINASTHGIGYGSYSDPYGLRSEIQHITNETKETIGKTIDEIASSFHDLIHELKPLLDVFYCVIPQSTSHSSKHHRHSIARSIPISLSTSPNLSDISTNLLAIDIENSLSSHRLINHDYVSHIVWSFNHCLCQCIEINHRLVYYNYVYNNNVNQYVYNDSDIILTSHQSINQPFQTNDQTKSITIFRLLEDMINNEKLSTQAVSLQIELSVVLDSIGLIGSYILNQSGIQILKRIENELKVFDMPLFIKDSTYKSKSSARYELTSRLLLTNFITRSSKLLTNQINSALIELYKISKYSTLSYISSEQEESIRISNKLISIIKLLDHLTILCYIIYCESPPQVRQLANTSIMSGNQSTNRRMSTIGNRSVLPSNNNVLLDIERLFTQKIKIYDIKFDQSTTNQSMVDMIIGIVIKAIIKSIDEYVRVLNITHHTYVLIQVHTQVLKQVSIHLIKDNNEIEILLDHLNNTLFSRYLDAGNVNRFVASSPTNAIRDSNEVSIITQAVNAGMVELAKETILMNKH